MEETECSETSAYNILTPGNYPEESIKHSKRGESLKSRRYYLIMTFIYLSIKTIYSPLPVPKHRQFKLHAFFFYSSTAFVGLLLFVEVSKSHSDTTLGRTPLNEWWARRRDLYMTTHNTQKQQTSMPLEGFEHAIPTREWQQTHVLDRATNRMGLKSLQPDETEAPGINSITHDFQ
jgi:hypothetical protein